MGDGEEGGHLAVDELFGEEAGGEGRHGDGEEDCGEQRQAQGPVAVPSGPDPLERSECGAVVKQKRLVERGAAVEGHVGEGLSVPDSIDGGRHGQGEKSHYKGWDRCPQQRERPYLTGVGKGAVRESGDTLVVVRDVSEGGDCDDDGDVYRDQGREARIPRCCILPPSKRRSDDGHVSVVRSRITLKGR